MADGSRHLGLGVHDPCSTLLLFTLPADKPCYILCCCLQFIWANHLRPRVPMVLMAVPDVEAYVHQGVSHATHPEAAALPGFTPLTPLQPADTKTPGQQPAETKTPLQPADTKVCGNGIWLVLTWPAIGCCICMHGKHCLCFHVGVVSSWCDLLLCHCVSSAPWVDSYSCFPYDCRVPSRRWSSAAAAGAMSCHDTCLLTAKGVVYC